jgi:uncharacterized protein DUF4325
MRVSNPNVVRVVVADHFGSEPANRAGALSLQIEVLLPQIRSGKGVVFDFVGVDFVSQPFASALTSVLREETGKNFGSIVQIENASPLVAGALALAGAKPSRQVG